MGAFKSAVITKKGQELLAKVVAGTTKLEFTKIKVSDAKLSGDLASMTGIGTIKQEEKVASVVRKNGSNVTVSASFSNQTLGQGYYVRNLGLYANDPQAGEILYSISVADESTATADYMPPFNGIGVSSLMVDLVTAVSNASSVKVNVDPTAGATVAQIVNLQEQIDDVKSFVGYESSDVYGVEIDFPNRRFTRIAGAENLTAGADFDKLNPWGGRKRCILADDGTVLAYRGETGYTEAGATTVEIKKTVDGAEKTYASGTKVQVMVEQPVFYVKAVPVSSKNATSGKGKQYTKGRFYISPTPKAGFTAPRAFYDNHGIVQDKIYLSAFEGCIYDTDAKKYLTADEQVADFATDMLSSIAGVKPASGLTQNLTRANVRKLCTNRGTGWESHSIFAMAVTEWLLMIEYASLDAQRKVGRGVCDFTDDGKTNMSVNTGAKYYFRYMDDMVIFGSSKEELHKLKRELDEFMAVNLKQVLKHNWQVFPTKVRGVDFVGYRFFGEYTLLRKSTCKTFKRRMLSISSKRENNVSPTYSEWCSFNNYVGWLQHCDSFRLYQKYVEPNVEYMHNYYLKEVKGNAEICKRKNYSGERKAS